jgi:hypothetical protein
MTGTSISVKPNASNEGGLHHSQLRDQDEGYSVGPEMTPGNTYTDAAFLTALGECRSIPIRRMAIRMDSLAMLLRVGALEADEAADEINDLGLTLLEMVTAKQRRAAA